MREQKASVGRIAPTGKSLSKRLTFLWMLCVALTLLLECAEAAANRDFYKILEIKKNASSNEIKKAYRALTLKYHPDKNQGDEAAKEKFHDVADAYEVLSDPDKRRKYDRCGEECVNEPERQNNSPFGDIFSSFFGHGQ